MSFTEGGKTKREGRYNAIKLGIGRASVDRVLGEQNASERQEAALTGKRRSEGARSSSYV
jgi:hypothetical protein